MNTRLVFVVEEGVELRELCELAAMNAPHIKSQHGF